MDHEFYTDAECRANRRVRRWYQDNLLDVLQEAKEQRVRGVDASIELAKQLIQTLNEPVEKPVVVPLRDLEPYEDDKLMKPVAPELLAMLHGSTEKGGTEKYLRARKKMAPEDKYFFRVTTNWDYGWQQRRSRVTARDVNRGRCAILRETFYRKNNLAPDPRHYAQPAGGQISICSEYSCNF